MRAEKVVHSTFAIERKYPVGLAKVFAAFSDPAKKRRWFAEGDEEKVEAYEMDFRVGGRELVRSRLGKDTPFPGAALVNNGYFHDIVNDQRIVVASTMTLNDRLISASQSTFEFLEAKGATEMIFTDQLAFFEGADGPKMREQGWRVLFEKLAEELAR